MNPQGPTHTEGPPGEACLSWVTVLLRTNCSLKSYILHSLDILQLHLFEEALRHVFLCFIIVFMRRMAVLQGFYIMLEKKEKKSTEI